MAVLGKLNCEDRTILILKCGDYAPRMAGNDFKQVIVVRSDLKMGRGKIAAQVAHASLNSAEKARKIAEKWYEGWLRQGQAKVVVKVASLDELLRLKSQALREGLPVAVVEDAGLTQVPSGTVTCLGIGPGPTPLLDNVTGRLKLL